MPTSVQLGLYALIVILFIRYSTRRVISAIKHNTLMGSFSYDYGH